MVYTKNRKNNRIQDSQQINYVKNILETAVAKCQQASMHDPTVYHATAQRIADTNSLNDPNKPRVTFDTKQQKIKGQQEPVLELTATIGDRTSTSYFLVKDSAAPGSKPTQEQLTYLRPDVVSARIQASLGLTTAVPATNPINTRAVPHPAPVNHTRATPSKAQTLAQTMGQQAPTPLQTPTQPTTSNLLADKLAALANPVFPFQSDTKSSPLPPPSDHTKERVSNSAAPQAIKPIHNLTPAQMNNKTTKNMQAIGKVNISLGQALKDMSEGEINPVQLYGYALETMGNFINGIPAGIHEARLKQIASKINEVNRERATVNRLMKETGNTVSQWEKNELTPSDTQPQTAAPHPFPSSANPSKVAPQPKDREDREAESEGKAPEKLTAIDKLLKTNLPIEDKLDAIEKTLDEMLKELTAMRVSLEATQAAVQAEIEATKTSAADAEGKVVESQAMTEVEVVANEPGTHVLLRTEIDTDIVAEAKTQTEAAKEVEVPQVRVDPTPDEEINIAEELAEAISSYQGDITKLNKHLKSSNLKIARSEDGSTFTVKELHNNLASTVFTAESSEAGWSIDSRINDSVKLDVLSSFYAAETTAKADREPEVQGKISQPQVVEHPSLELT